MARTQTYDPTGGTAPPAPAPTTTQVASPIGVPFYNIDPSTGQPYVDQNGQPLRWAATVQGNTTDVAMGQPAHTQYVPPRYFDGAQWIPGSLPPDQIAALQKRMIQAGIIKQGQTHVGVWDTNSMQAYTEVLAFANSAGLDVGTALDRWVQQETKNPTPGLATQVTSPDDLKLAFRKTWINDLGQAPDEAQLDRMVAAYQSQERGAQTNQHDLVSGTAPPSPTAYADAQARDQQPTGVQAHDALGYQDQFFSMLKGVV